jgi:cytochrome c-type biogenesis protein CcmH
VAFWVIAAALVAAVVMIIIRPLRAPPPAAVSDTAGDLAVYRDQLAELDTEVARGLLQPEDAEAAKTEISRRMLARADIATVAPAATSAAPRLAAIIAAVGVPLVGLSFYLTSGVPGLPDQPRSGRVAAPVETASVAELIARVEQRIIDQPEDGRGWEVIAPVYMKQQRYADAARAYGNAIRLLGETVPRLAGMGEAHIKAANGVISDVAREAYTRILKLDPGRIEPRFWLAMALEQDGQLAQAAAAYRALLAEAAADAPWRTPVLERLAVVDPASAAKAAPGQLTARGPSASDVAAAQQMTPEARAEMISGMVAGLEQRLARDGSDVDGWQKLIRAHMVLGDKTRANQALRNAKQALAKNASGLAAVLAAAKALGIGS